MLTTVEGIFRSGRIELSEKPEDLDQARVIVTFLTEEPPAKVNIATSPSTASSRMLDLLRAWQAEPLSPEERDVLDEFATFQTQHPLRLARLDEEP